MLLKSKTEEKRMDPRIKRTRQMLVEAMQALMAEKSVNDITIQDIAERATVNRVTFYAHFTDKDALVDYMLRARIHNTLSQHLPEGSRLSPENLTKLIVTVCEFLTQMGSHCPPPHNELEPLMEKQIKAELCEVLKAWLLDEPAPKRKGGGPELAAMMASWAIYGAVTQWKLQDKREPAPEFARKVLPIITASLKASMPG
jgi:AcrR family transcriptional regulator